MKMVELLSENSAVSRTGVEVVIVPLASIAREVGSSARALMRRCAARRIPMIVVKHWYSQSAFVRLRDRNAVLSYRPMFVWIQQRSAERKRRLAAKERELLKVLDEVKQGRITKKQAALELGLSAGHVYRVLARWRVGRTDIFSG